MVVLYTLAFAAGFVGYALGLGLRRRYLKTMGKKKTDG